MSLYDGMDGSERRNLDRGAQFPDDDMDLTGINAGINGLMIGQQTGYDFPQFSAPIGDLFSRPMADEPLATGHDQGATGYNLRSQRPRNTAIDFDEFDRQREMSEQRRLAALWANAARDIEAETHKLQSNVYSAWDPTSAIRNVDKLMSLWKSFEELHPVYLNGIKDRKRLEFVEAKYRELKESVTQIIQECRMQMRTERQQEPPPDDNFSVKSFGSQRSQQSTPSKEKLKAMLMAKKRLELAKAREREEAEIARMMYERNRRIGIRKLEEQVVLAELEWRIESQYEDDTDELDSIYQPIDYISAPQEDRAASTGYAARHSKQEGVASRRSPPPLLHDDLRHERREDRPHRRSCEDDYARTSAVDYGTTPKDPIAAMWKIQLLNGIRPTQFSGKPSEFPFFRAQIKNHLESDLLTDSQRVEYLPKFLTGDALEVLKRNRGCSYETIVQILEERFGRPVQVAQHFIEELVSGPKIGYGNNVALLNFSDKLIAATKVLRGEYETEVSVATNLRKIVNRLPNDMITKWQQENYRINEEGRAARLSDVATFVKKHALIKNDPVFGLPRQDPKENKPASRNDRVQMPRKPSTISTTSLKPNDQTSTRCDICKGSAHKLTQCPMIVSCDKTPVRRQYAASYGFCFNCGLQRPGHGSGSCPEPPSCKRCSGRHLDILHEDRKTPSNKSTRTVNESTRTSTEKTPARNADETATYSKEAKKTNATTTSPSVGSHGASTEKTPVLLNVVPVIVTSEPGNSTSTYAFMDNGCTDSLIDQELVDQLDIQGVPTEIQINTITNSHVPQKSQRVKFTVTAADGCGEDIIVEGAYVLPSLNQSQRKLPENIDVWQYPHLRDLQFPRVDVPRVSVIIGNDVPSAHVQLEVRPPEDPKDGLFGFRHLLGWSVAGPLDTKQHEANLNYISIDQKLDKQIEQFWSLESLGTTTKTEGPLSEDDKLALGIIEDTTSFKQGHYEVGLLWRHNNTRLPNNRLMAEKRLESLKRRLINPENREMATKYRDVIKEYVEKGYARKLSPEEAAHESDRCWYLPHHPVTNPNKPGKVRVVFDAASEFEGTSLNKNLVQGPDMTNNLVGVLLRFRQGNVAFAADVEAMFHQVKVREEDRDALRFLWWTKGLDEPPDVYVMQVHIFGAASSPCVANSVLKRTASDNAQDFSPEAVNAVKRNFYVDDALPSTDSEASAGKLASEMTEILARGGFNLTKFTSNSKSVLSLIPEERRANPRLNLDLEELPVERALGVRWFAETDELGFEVKDLVRPETKRGILSTICSLYDPLGFASPVTLTAKSIVQDLWRTGAGWDDPLEPSVLQRWRIWKELLPSLADVRIPRCYFREGTDVSSCELQLHHFADASEKGYGTVSYLRIKHPDDTIQCSFVMGKTRNAPLKFTSIPRLELQAAVLSTRMNKMLREELDLPIQKSRYWTDSEIVLHYLKNRTRRFKTFVANRIEEIKENSLPEEWSHVPGTLNPADDASRGKNPSELTLDHRWLHGPDFLWMPETCWPNCDVADVPEEMLEVKGEGRKNVIVNAVSAKVKDEGPKPDATNQPMNHIQKMIKDCSLWNTLRRKIAWLLRFTKFIRDRKTVPTGELTPQDYQEATSAIARIIQSSAYESEKADLQAKGAVGPRSKIANLNPVLDKHEVLRVNGRVKGAPITGDTTQQIILPKEHHVSSLIVRHTHFSIGHLGREHVLAKVREQFWIPGARILIRSILHHCITCKKINAAPITQQMAPLPADRTTAFEPPFSYTGMDLFGPLHVKHGRGTAKRWCCLFTCLNTRSVHLELVNSLDADDFILCLRRFINRRGEVTQIRCDRGTNFVGAERELRESLEEWNRQIERELVQRGCRWIFQPPTASSMSGVWERMVRSAKNVLKATIGQRTLTDPALQTLLTEIERILNGRALTANSEDPNDLQALTPAHFLMQRTSICLPPGVFDDNDLYHRKKWKQIQYLADLFWRRWLKEYIPSLQTRSKWHRVQPNLMKNALVLLVDHTVPRGHWKLGRVLETYPGADGIVRTAKVKTKSGELLRPIQKLCLLESDLEAAQV